MAATGKILFVDDDASLRTVIAIALSREGYEIDTADCGERALEMFAGASHDLVIHDIRMPGMNGLELLDRLLKLEPGLPVVVMTAFSTWDVALEAMRLGAFDYIKKPFDNHDLRQLVKRALAHAAAPGPAAETARMIGASAGMKEILDIVGRVAKTDSTVLIQGESGSGKELVAASIHSQSHRQSGPFMAVNCGGFSETLLESELFGHLKGAFTGAVANKNGLLQLADGGTFFLDEIGETSTATQVKLLRVLETRTFFPVGGETIRQVDVRFIAATNRDLAEMVSAGAFREDLYYRLNIIPIQVPPLRERRDDIPLLAGHFLSLYAKRFNRPVSGFTPGAMDAILSYDWPGNIRELQNAVQRAVSLAEGKLVNFTDVFPSWTSARRTKPDSPRPPAAAAPARFLPAESGFDLEKTLADVERGYIRAALEKSGNNLTRAAEILGINFRSIRYRIKKLGLDQ
ncbi:MAG: sigma-54 dependent transcriptional regulator [Planctomycetota bacterium]|jgi:two-component system response regulator PilR (NtrC family)|nr:sigma-54 dependent transcriptional regulator [Planctomycetota bacterium]